MIEVSEAAKAREARLARINQTPPAVPFVRVAIAIPHGADIGPHKFHHAHQQMVLAAAAQGIQIAETYILRQEVAKARIDLVRSALEADCTHVFFLDDDMTHPPDALTKLLAHNLDIVSGLYLAREYPHTPQMYEDAIESHNIGKYWMILDWEDGAMVEAHAVGAGCLLVKTEVFRTLPEPWFIFLDNLGEDFGFCAAARRHGYKVLVDTSVKCSHYQLSEITVDMWQKLRPLVHLVKDGGDVKPVGGAKEPVQWQQVKVC